MNALRLGISCILLATVGPLLAHGAHHDDDHHEGHRHDDDEESHLVALSEEQITTADITTAKARPGQIVRQVRAPGKVVIPPQQIVHVVPKVAGTVEAAYKQIGDTVEAGETVALIASREVAEFKASYCAAVKRAAVKDAVYARERELRDRQLTTDQEFWQAEVEAAEAAIDAALNRQKLLALGLASADIDSLSDGDAGDLRLYHLRAPAGGTVIAHNLAPGAYVDMQTDAYLLADFNRRWLEIDLPASYYNVVGKGCSVQATVHNGSHSHMHVRAVVDCCKPVVEEKTRTLKLYATYEGVRAQWPPGTFVTAVIDATAVRRPLVIPKAAVQTVDDQSVVFVQHPSGFEIRPVTLGDSDDVRVAVTSGLSRGERYAVRNAFLLKAEHEKDEAAHEH